MSAGRSKMVIDHMGQSAFLVEIRRIFEPVCSFDINSSSEVLIGDDPLQCRRYLRIKHSQISVITPFT